MNSSCSVPLVVYRPRGSQESFGTMCQVAPCQGLGIRSQGVASLGLSSSVCLRDFPGASLRPAVSWQFLPFLKALDDAWRNDTGFHPDPAEEQLVCDDPTCPNGGYWIVKNGWRTGAGDVGFGCVPGVASIEGCGQVTVMRRDGQIRDFVHDT